MSDPDLAIRLFGVGTGQQNVPFPGRNRSAFEAFSRTTLGRSSFHVASAIRPDHFAGHLISKGTWQNTHFHRTGVFESFAAFYVPHRPAVLELKDTSLDNTIYSYGHFGDKRVEKEVTQMNIGSDAPEINLKDGEGKVWMLSNYKGHTVVLLFYPGDNTPVCTAQLCSVRDHWSEYQATGAEVVGISTDTVESHKSFAEKNQLPLRLLSDTDRKVSTAYDMKSWLPGRSARGVVVIDKDGKIAYHKTQALSLFRPADDDVLAAIKSAQ